MSVDYNLYIYTSLYNFQVELDHLKMPAACAAQSRIIYRCPLENVHNFRKGDLWGTLLMGVIIIFLHIGFSYICEAHLGGAATGVIMCGAWEFVDDFNFLTLEAFWWIIIAGVYHGVLLLAVIIIPFLYYQETTEKSTSKRYTSTERYYDDIENRQ